MKHWHGSPAPLRGRAQKFLVSVITLIGTLNVPSRSAEPPVHFVRGASVTNINRPVGTLSGGPEKIGLCVTYLQLFAQPQTAQFRILDLQAYSSSPEAIQQMARELPSDLSLHVASVGSVAAVAEGGKGRDWYYVVRGSQAVAALVTDLSDNEIRNNFHNHAHSWLAKLLERDPKFLPALSELQSLAKGQEMSPVILRTTARMAHRGEVGDLNKPNDFFANVFFPSILPRRLSQAIGYRELSTALNLVGYRGTDGVPVVVIRLHSSSN